MIVCNSAASQRTAKPSPRPGAGVWPGRRGAFTLTEAVLAIGATAAIVAASLPMLTALIHAQRSVRSVTSALAATDQLEHQLRADLRRALAAAEARPSPPAGLNAAATDNAASVLELMLPEGRVRYELEPHRIVRWLEAGGEARRQTFSVYPYTALEWTLESSSWPLVSVTAAFEAPAAGQSPQRVGVPLPALRVDAWLGRDHRAAGSLGAAPPPADTLRTSEQGQVP